MKPTRLSGLLAAALAVGSISALHAAGQFSGLPVVGGAAVCTLYAGDGTTCQGYVPAGPTPSPASNSFRPTPRFRAASRRRAW
jgi:hypothetical protein